MKHHFKCSYSVHTPDERKWATLSPALSHILLWHSPSHFLPNPLLPSPLSQGPTRPSATEADIFLPSRWLCLFFSLPAFCSKQDERSLLSQIPLPLPLHPSPPSPSHCAKHDSFFLLYHRSTWCPCSIVSCVFFFFFCLGWFLKFKRTWGESFTAWAIENEVQIQNCFQCKYWRKKYLKVLFLKEKTNN